MSWPFRRRPAPADAPPRSLSSLAPGESGTVARVVASDPGRLVKLSSLGIMTGVRVTLVQKRPAVVLQIAETSVAIDRAVADDILIEPAGPVGRGQG